MVELLAGSTFIWSIWVDFIEFSVVFWLQHNCFPFSYLSLFTAIVLSRFENLFLYSFCMVDFVLMISLIILSTTCPLDTSHTHKHTCEYVSVR